MLHRLRQSRTLYTLTAGPKFGVHFTRLKSQRNESAPTNCLLFALSVFSPLSGKGGDAAIGTAKAQRDKIGVQLLQRALLLARSAGLRIQPG